MWTGREFASRYSGDPLKSQQICSVSILALMEVAEFEKLGAYNERRDSTVHVHVPVLLYM